jgi:thymidine kinase
MPNDIKKMSHHGQLEVICGPMFSGKTEELIRRLRRVEYARLRSIVFKPKIDIRYSPNLVVSHSEQKIKSCPVADVAMIRTFLASGVKPFHVIGLDEVHFFEQDVVHLCEDLVSQGIRVIAAGLCEDYLGMPFGAMPELLVHADIVTKLLAVCMRCGEPASKSQRISRPDNRSHHDQVLIGAHQHYEARCRSCFKKAVEELPDDNTNGASMDEAYSL